MSSSTALMALLPSSIVCPLLCAWCVQPLGEGDLWGHVIKCLEKCYLVTYLKSSLAVYSCFFYFEYVTKINKM